MSDLERRFHETWLGMVQPIDGLVVSIPVLVDAQCMERQPPETQRTLLALCPPSTEGEAGPEGHTIADLRRFFTDLLGFAAEAFDDASSLPEAVSLFVPEGRQVLRPTLALKSLGPSRKLEGEAATPASLAAAGYELFLWQIPNDLELDKPEAVTGDWHYPPTAKFERLLRHCRVPIGLLVNGTSLRLVYAPHGESSGSITFRLDDMASVGGRPILDAFVLLLSANRFFGVAEERTLGALLAESRKRQANVTTALAEQVFEALQILLRGFEAAAARDGQALLDDALQRGGDHLYQGLLTVLLRLVFILYAEDRSLLPVEHPLYAAHYSLVGLFDELVADHGSYPDSMSRRFGAWGRLIALFRAIFVGVSHGTLSMPPREGSLFNPHEYPFLEGWGPAGSSPIKNPEAQAEVHLPTVDDETVFRMLERLLVFEGQRLSYRALDVEQIGSVYEALMGYHVIRVGSPAVCIRPDRIWVTAEEALAFPAARRAKALKEALSLTTAQAEKLASELEAANGGNAAGIALEALEKFAAKGTKTDPSLWKARSGQLVLQPGSERRRTSSHYTPRSLSAPIVRRTLEPLLSVMGEAPASERILSLKICDPAMGSGAFLVEACRYLADHVVAAWTREGALDAITADHGEPVLYARRLVAQRCLYGVDKNKAAVELGKLSLWLVTLARTLPFTFLDHALRHGDSLVGLDFEQIKAFHWKRPEEKADRKKGPQQLDLFGREIEIALSEAIGLRNRIGALGDSPEDDKEKGRLFWDAQDALDRVRLIGDVLVGAFFACEKDKEREKERVRREELVRAWLRSGEAATEELRELQREILAKLPVFHWMVEFPEVFHAKRADPLDGGMESGEAFMDAFVGNPPFLGGTMISSGLGSPYLNWLCEQYDRSGNRADLVAYFFRRVHDLLGTHGTLGLIATNTIAQGDTRTAGLQYLIERGAMIYEAVESLLWPGAAAVSVSVVHLAIGNAAQAVGTRRLNGEPVLAINSQLTSKRESVDPAALQANTQFSFCGTKIYGQGFVLTPGEREGLNCRSLRNDERVFPYIGGEEVNSSPTQAFRRYVINFAEMTLEEAQRWPDLITIVRERVKPEREKVNREGYRKYWWQYPDKRPALYAAIAPLKRCLVTARVTKHLCFSFQPTGRIFNEKLYVFPFEHITPFAVLQSRVHGPWVWLLSSTMKNDLNYAASDCFETFPFPKPDPRSTLPALEDIGERLYSYRAAYMVDQNVGLTVTYNRLKDPACTEARILELRRLHEEMDRKVIEAYAEGDPEGRWLELEVPAFCPMGEGEREALSRFEEGVIERLFALNEKRAKEEAILGLGSGGKKKAPAAPKKAVAKKATATGPEGGEKKARGRRKKGEGQLELGGGGPGRGERGVRSSHLGRCLHSARCTLRTAGTSRSGERVVGAFGGFRFPREQSRRRVRRVSFPEGTERSAHPEGFVP